MDAVFAATRGGLWAAASALAATPRPAVGIITGFFVPGGEPPAAETDGPAGAALLARSLSAAGLACRLATDALCAGACRVALDTAGAGAVPVDAVAPDGSPAFLAQAWRQAGINWVIAIERCGPSADGVPRNMRGVDLSPFTAPLDRVFSAGPWRTIGIGDGGNEIGMGSLDPAVIAGHVPLGDQIGCVVPAEFLLTAGVSHWGAYALLEALALLRPDWAITLDPMLDEAIVAAMVRDGPAVDGVSRQGTVTIDGLGMEAHRAVLAAVRSALARSKEAAP